jgi:Xaa-Pro aminopeptidase
LYVIEPREHRERRATLREALTRRGFDAAVAWSRGGGTQDGYADVLYLTGFYTHQPYVPDRAGRWRATGHTAVVVPAAGAVSAVIDSESLQEPDPVADALRASADPLDTVAELLAGGRRARRVWALLGGAALATRWERALREGLVRRGKKGAADPGRRARDVPLGAGGRGRRGRSPDPTQRALLEAVRDSVMAGVEQVRPHPGSLRDPMSSSGRG